MDIVKAITVSLAIALLYTLVAFVVFDIDKNTAAIINYTILPVWYLHIRHDQEYHK